MTTPNVYDVIDPPGTSAASTAVTPGNMADALRGTDAPQNVYDAIDPPKPAPSAVDQLTDPETWKRQLGLAGRAVVEGVAGLPNMAADAGVATRNLVGDAYNSIAGQPATPDYELPSSIYSKALTQAGFPEPANAGERIAGMVEGGLAGAKVPGVNAGEAGNAVRIQPGPNVGTAADVPANFMNPTQTKAQLLAQSLQKAQGQGFVVPPSTTNPTLFNRVIETVAGKENVQNWARRINDAQRQGAAASTLGFSADTPLTVSSMDAIKAQSGQAYEAARGIGQFRTSDDYLTRLAEIEQQNTGANASFPGASSPDVAKVIDTYLQPTMTGDAAVSAVKLLRTKASDAFSSGNSETGRVYRQIGGAIEDELERGATQQGQPNLVQRLRAARQDYAKASTIQDAMEPDGTVTGPGLARAWNNNVPMSGPLESAAEFARQFPKTNLSSTASGSPVHHLSTVESGAGAAAGMLAEHLMRSGGEHSGGALGPILWGTAGAAAVPAARNAARRYLLSPSGQAGAIPSLGPGGRTISPAALAAGLSAYQGDSQ